MSNQSPQPSRTYRNVALFFLALSVVAWAAPLPTDWTPPFKIVLPLATLAFASAWLYNRTPTFEEAPDVLGGIFPAYFERDGLCFAPELLAEDGVCWFNVYCQNRYDRPCRGTVYFFPMEGTSATPGQPSEVQPMIAEIDCDGGEAAVVSFPYPVAAKWQGRIMVYDVAAAVEHPSGRGDLIRVREGIHVSPPTSRQRETLKVAAIVVGGIFGRVPVEGPKASCELRLPERVAEREPADTTPRISVLWRVVAPPRSGASPVSGGSPTQYPPPGGRNES